MQKSAARFNTLHVVLAINQTSQAFLLQRIPFSGIKHILNKHSNGSMSSQNRSYHHCIIHIPTRKSLEPMFHLSGLWFSESVQISGYWVGPDVEDGWGFDDEPYIITVTSEASRAMQREKPVDPQQPSGPQHSVPIEQYKIEQLQINPPVQKTRRVYYIHRVVEKREPLVKRHVQRHETPQSNRLAKRSPQIQRRGYNRHVFLPHSRRESSRPDPEIEPDPNLAGLRREHVVYREIERKQGVDFVFDFDFDPLELLLLHFETSHAFREAPFRILARKALKIPALVIAPPNVPSVGHSPHGLVYRVGSEVELRGSGQASPSGQRVAPADHEGLGQGPIIVAIRAHVVVHVLLELGFHEHARVADRVVDFVDSVDVDRLTSGSGLVFFAERCFWESDLAEGDVGRVEGADDLVFEELFVLECRHVAVGWGFFVGLLHVGLETVLEGFELVEDFVDAGGEGREVEGGPAAGDDEVAAYLVVGGVESGEGRDADEDDEAAEHDLEAAHDSPQAEVGKV
ncbi:tRNA uridine 5-carboxymethylaminomethyl modification enzyme MnmG [Striga asiatica]|uniref:tRNA uridine 5-carboxymethylaminomethyl modification enzyme MnmG n=1 Tax=Striga asiatica TaxID=4170 RepID=A0A5A7RL84_STRAF|nr:tRNA uridine 5-carboxymethylaminomethyl modification enzyme MnmG [Striga asiatica]